MSNISLNFKRSEFACQCGCGFDVVDAELITILEELRVSRGLAVKINSGCRCESHNKSIGGRSSSQHLLGKAADIVVEGYTPKEIQDYLKDKYPNKYGIGSYNTFTHIDSRSNKARW